MKIVVLVKEVPDTWGERKLNLETGIADRAASDPVLDEIGERSLEVALACADTNPAAEVVILSMSPATASATVRKGLAMGAASAVHVVDESLLGADLGLTAQVLAAALRRVGFDLVITGNQSTDGSGGVLPAMLGELLDVPAALNLISVEIASESATGVRATDGGTAGISVQFPALISITEALPDARFPNFKGIMAAKKKPYETLSLAHLGVEADDTSAARSIIIGLAPKAQRQAGVKVIDEGDAGAKLAEFLIQNRLA
jgi:electron transfer flavoprotein beta subunit